MSQLGRGQIKNFKIIIKARCKVYKIWIQSLEHKNVGCYAVKKY